MTKKNEEKKKKVLIPGSLRQRLMAAISMLLVATVLLVSSTYAWFTLSTAPEVTGITTSVGANGNLEIALLPESGDTSYITSLVGDSTAAGKSQTAANGTWGNLVGLSDSSYGLNGIKLMPASANITGSEIDTSSLLKTPVYGADGRVSEVEANTKSATYNTSSGFVVSDSQKYGVRAVGVSNNVSKASDTYYEARTTAKASAASATTDTATAINDNSATIIALAQAGGSAESYTSAQITALTAIATGMENSLKKIVKAYSATLAAVAINTAATADLQETTAVAVESLITNTDASKFAAADEDTPAGEYNAYVGSYSNVFTALATAQADVTDAKTAFGGYTPDSKEVTEVNAAVAKLIGSSSAWTFDADSNNLEGFKSNALAGSVCSVYLAGDLQTIADFAGSFSVASLLKATAYAGAADTVAQKATLLTTVNAMKNSDLIGTTTATISDTYGYCIDFAFRTNASSSNLQLQTAAANRVYEDETNEELATQGAGSTVTYTYGGDLTATQAEKLLDAIKFVFFDPNNGTVYAQGSLSNINTGDTSATANIIINGQSGDVGTITALTQNTAKKVSILVYMEGENIQNSDVVNGQNSGTINFNLQFSSSADLIPMNNTALKTMTKTAS